MHSRKIPKGLVWLSGLGDSSQEIALSPPAPPLLLLLVIDVVIIDCLKRPKVSLQPHECFAHLLPTPCSAEASAIIPKVLRTAHSFRTKGSSSQWPKAQKALRQGRKGPPELISHLCPLSGCGAGVCVSGVLWEASSKGHCSALGMLCRLKGFL